MGQLKKIFLGLGQIIESISEFTGLIAGIGILLAGLIICYEVFIVRHILHEPAIWQTETSVYLLIMATFVGAAYGLKHDGHVSVDFLIIHLPPGVRVWLKIITSILAVGFCYVIAFKSWGMWWEATSNGWRSDTLWGPSLVIPYILVPLGMTLVCLQYVVKIFKTIGQLKELKKGFVPDELKKERAIH